MGFFEKMMMARNWGVDPSDVEDDTPLTRWVERQIDYIADRFDLDLPKIDVHETPGGRRPSGHHRTMAVGGHPGDGSYAIMFIASDVTMEYTPEEMHFVVRHEIAHIVDRQMRGDSDEDSPEFRAILERLNAPLSGRVTETKGVENCQQCIEQAPIEVLQFASDAPW